MAASGAASPSPLSRGLVSATSWLAGPLPGVNAGYITRDSLLHDHLRKQQERISKVIIDSAKGKTDGPDLSWLHKGKVATLRVRPEEELKAAA